MKSSKLIRDNVQEENSTALSGEEYVNAVLNQISTTALNIKTKTEAEDVLCEVSDILELINSYLSTQNLKPGDLMDTASKLRNELGTFSKKLSVQDKE